LSKAQERELDLILVSPNSTPPVCKIGDIGKLKYEQTKKDKEAKKSQKTGSIKEIKITPKIGKHDLEVRIKHSTEFLSKGHKVKITLFFRGREITHIDIGMRLVDQMVTALNAVGKVEQEPKMEGKRMHLIIAPK
jgi:translation initiation factor IF-3